MEARLRLEQLRLPVVHLPCQVAPQLQITVDHQVDDTQHQIGRAGRQLDAGISGLGAAGVEQPERIGVAHAAVGRMHRQQDVIEHGKGHRTGVDAPEHRWPALPLAWQFVFGRGVAQTQWLGVSTARRQTAKDQDVVLRGVVVVRRQLAVEQVRDMQVDQLGAGQTLQGRLNLRLSGLEFRSGASDPDEAWRCRRRRRRGRVRRRRRVRQHIGLDDLAGSDVKNPHRKQSGLAQFACGVDGEVRQHTISTGTFEGQQAFHHDRIVV